MTLARGRRNIVPMKTDPTPQFLRLVAYFMCFLLITIAVLKYEGAGIAVVAGAFALIADVLSNLPPNPGGM